MHPRLDARISLRPFRSLLLGFVALAAAALGVSSCSSSSNDDCSDTEVRVDYIGGSRDGTTVCKPIPASCGTAATCDNDTCRGAMYGYCDSPYLGVGCSDTFPPTIISCNP